MGIPYEEVEHAPLGYIAELVDASRILAGEAEERLEDVVEFIPDLD